MRGKVCRQCGTANRGGARYCRRCGAVPLQPCGVCGATTRRFDARFCYRCGGALSGLAVAPRLTKA